MNLKCSSQSVYQVVGFAILVTSGCQSVGSRTSAPQSVTGALTTAKNADGSWTVYCADGTTKEKVPESRLNDPNDMVCSPVSNPIGEVCNEIDPFGNPTVSLIKVLKKRGYPEDGSLLYPDGKTFLMKRSAGQPSDYSLSYLNGKSLLVRKNMQPDDRTIYWPNGNILRLSKKGLPDDGTIFRSDGKTKWLVRDRHNPDKDRDLSGSPREELKDGNTITNVVVLGNGELRLAVTMFDRPQSPTWRIQINVASPPEFDDSNLPKVTIRECF